MSIYITKQILENRMRAFKTCALVMSFVGLGMCQASLGPSMLDLKLAVNVSLSDITWMIPARMTGYAIKIIGFVLFPYINPFLCDAVCLLSTALCMIAIPYNRTFIGMLLTLMVSGITLGMIDAIGNLTVLFLWGNECHGFMQILHFAFGFGGILGPLIARPYMVPLEDDSKSPLLDIYKPDHLKIQYAFLIIAIYLLCISTIFAFIFVRYRDTLEHPSRMVPYSLKANISQQNKTTYKIVVSLAIIFMHIYYGNEIAMSNFLIPFACYSDLKLSKQTGAIITSLYWSTYTFFRLIPVFYKFSPKKSIVAGLALIMLANWFLILYENVWCLWIGAAVIGMGMSTIWASMFGYLENYFPVIREIAASFTMSACFGELIIPKLMGSYIVEIPTIFLWITFSCSLATCTLFFFINELCKTRLVDPFESHLFTERYES